MKTKTSGSPELVHAPTLRRIFRCHIHALIVTAIVVLALLIGFPNVPLTLATSLCVLIACSLIIFPTLTIASARKTSELRVSQKFEYVIVSVGIAFAQLIFVLPLIACIVVPTVNFKTILFG